MIYLHLGHVEVVLYMVNQRFDVENMAQSTSFLFTHERWWIFPVRKPLTAFTRPGQFVRPVEMEDLGIFCWGTCKKTYPLVNIQKAIENGHRNSGFSH